MTNQRWRVVFGAIAALCSFLLVQPQVQDMAWVAIVIGAVNVVVAFLRAPDDTVSE